MIGPTRFAVSVLMLCLWVSPALGATYYIGVGSTASDGNPGTTQSAPLATFDTAVRRLTAGDTLILLDGTYTENNSGLLRLFSKNGTASHPITIKALNERQAWLRQTALDPDTDAALTNLRIADSSWLVFEGLRISNQSSGVPVDYGNNAWITNSNNLVFRRMLAHDPNHGCNCHQFDIHFSDRVTVEDSEFYNFHRNAVTAYESTNTVARRNYCNSRPPQLLAYPPPNPDNDTGDVCFAAYPASNSIVENVISENNYKLASIIGQSTADNNKVFGSIALNNVQSYHYQYRNTEPTNTYFENVVAIGSDSVGLFQEGGRLSTCKNCTVLNGNYGLLGSDEAWTPNGSSEFINLLAVGNTVGIDMTRAPNFTISFVNSFGNGTNYIPGSEDTRYSGARSTDPQLGTCLVYLPDGSPMKGAGQGGADIGANVLYRYENGTLTTTPLWGPDGAFPCGTVVAGLNDVAGSSCRDVHQRLNVNSNGCAFPSGYGGTTPGDE